MWLKVRVPCRTLTTSQPEPLTQHIKWNLRGTKLTAANNPGCIRQRLCGPFSTHWETSSGSPPLTPGGIPALVHRNGLPFSE